MLYHALPRTTKTVPPVEMHYFDSADLLWRLQGQGYSRADMARMAGITIPQMQARLNLHGLDEGLKRYLRAEGVPEHTALALLSLPDAVSRRRMAYRIVRERLCIRDARLLVASAQRRWKSDAEARPVAEQRVITVMRDVRLYRNAIRDIAEQMKTAGVRATFTERRTGGMLELTVSYPARRRRTERYQSI